MNNKLCKPICIYIQSHNILNKQSRSDFFLRKKKKKEKNLKKKDVCPFLLLENSRPLSVPWELYYYYYYYIASVVSDSVRPNRRQPTRLRHPWDSPGKNTGVGCHFLMKSSGHWILLCGRIFFVMNWCF